MNQANSLEAFIEKLHDEGVEAGIHDADELRTAAAAESAAIIDQAQDTSRQLIAQAEARAEALLADAKNQVALAVRDAQLELRARLERTLTALLEEGLAHDLEDPELLTRLLVEVVGAYARADGDPETLEVKVHPDLTRRLAAAVPGILGRALANGTCLDLKAGLETVGFEYRVRDSVVEVTPQSVAAQLEHMLSPQLRTLLRSVADGQRVALQ